MSKRDKKDTSSSKKQKIKDPKQQEIKLEQQKQQAREKVRILETSGILDAYQYLLRQVCKNGLPDTNIFEFAAQQILKYEKKMKLNNKKRQELYNITKSAVGIEKNNISKISPDKKLAPIIEDRSKEKQKIKK